MKRGVRLVLLVVLGILVLHGCAGPGPARTGAAKGYVVVGPSGPEVRCCVCDLPPGYRIAVGAIVRIVGLEGKQDTTDWRGSYYIGGIPPGLWTLEVIYDDWPPYRIQILIVAGRVTCGTGHSEGGGG